MITKEYIPNVRKCHSPISCRLSCLAHQHSNTGGCQNGAQLQLAVTLFENDNKSQPLDAVGNLIIYNICCGPWIFD